VIHSKTEKMAKRRKITDERIRALIGEEAIERHERVQRELAELSAYYRRKEDEARRTWEAEQAKKAS
jgi:hypothetical protein